MSAQIDGTVVSTTTLLSSLLERVWNLPKRRERKYVCYHEILQVAKALRRPKEPQRRAALCRCFEHTGCPL